MKSMPPCRNWRPLMSRLGDERPLGLQCLLYAHAG
jgi:hypothetical protein